MKLWDLNKMQERIQVVQFDKLYFAVNVGFGARIIPRQTNTKQTETRHKKR